MPGAAGTFFSPARPAREGRCSRERGEDIQLLVPHLLEKYRPESGPVKKMSPEAMSLLAAYPWPGNVLELDGAMHKTATWAGEDIIGVELLKKDIRGET